MKFLNWKIQLALALIGASAGLYALNYLIFRDANYMTRLFLAQLGFLPISVLLVTIILNQLLAQRARAIFSEGGAISFAPPSWRLFLGECPYKKYKIFF